MIQQLAQRGYGYGSGTLDPSGQKFLINIPKKASSYLLDWCSKHGWTAAHADQSNNNITELIVVLRDPLERWVSGVAQYLTSYVLNVTGAYSTKTGPGPDDQQMSAHQFIQCYNPVVERLLFDQCNRLDDHVWPQHEFFENLLITVPRKYFFINADFDNQIAQYLKFQPIENLDANLGSSNIDTHKIQQFIRSRLNSRPDLEQRVRKAYYQDYNLIKQIFNT